MRRRAATVQLKELAEIRELQRLRAEAETMKAASTARAGRNLLERCEQEKEETAERWRGSLSAATVLPEVTNLWARALMQRNDATLRAEADMRAAEDKLDRCAIDHNAASARRDATDRLAKNAFKQDVRKQEDVALQNALDRHTQQKGGRE